MLCLIALQDPLAYALSNTTFFLSILLRSVFVVFAMASALFLDVHGCCSLCYKQLLPHHPGLARASDAKVTTFFLSILLRSVFVVCEVFAMASALFLDVHGCCSLCYKQLLPHHPGLARASDTKVATME